MADEPVTLELISRQQHAMLAEMRAFRAEMIDFRDQMLVQTAIALRVDRSQSDWRDQLNAMVRLQESQGRRLQMLDERVRALEQEHQ